MGSRRNQASFFVHEQSTYIQHGILVHLLDVIRELMVIAVPPAVFFQWRRGTEQK